VAVLLLRARSVDPSLQLRHTRDVHGSSPGSYGSGCYLRHTRSRLAAFGRRTVARDAVDFHPCDVTAHPDAPTALAPQRQKQPHPVIGVGLLAGRAGGYCGRR